MACSVSGRSATVCLTSFAKLERLPTKGTLVNLALLCSGERHAIVLKLNHSVGSFTTHIMNSVLVAEPIGTFDL